MSQIALNQKTLGGRSSVDLGRFVKKRAPKQPESRYEICWAALKDRNLLAERMVIKGEIKT